MRSRSLWVPQNPIRLVELGLSPKQGRRREWAVALSFLYLAFLRTLRLLRLGRRDDTDLAIEVVMLRHEVAVLRRQVDRPALRPRDRALLAGLSRLIPRPKLGRFFVQPETLLGWHRDLVRRKWTLWVPRTPSMSRDQAILMDESTEAIRATEPWRIDLPKHSFRATSPIEVVADRGSDAGDDGCNGRRTRGARPRDDAD